MKLHGYWTQNWLRILSILGVFYILILVGFNMFHRPVAEHSEAEQAVKTKEATLARQTPVTPQKVSDSTSTSIPPLRDLADGMKNLPPGQVETILTAYWTDLDQSGMTAVEKAAILVAYLDSGHNLSTGQLFEVGPNGVLTSAPTLRVQALNWIGEIDANIAADYSWKIFEQSSSPDEWALALRNYGRVLDHPGTDDYFTSQVRALIANQTWQANPTRGYLEAFDSAVFSAVPVVIEDLLEVCFTSNHKGTRLAATMALDNIAGDNPLAVARIITQQGSMIENKPTFRASLMSRLDPVLPEHVEVLTDYLLNPAFSTEEKQVFAKAFPNHNDFASHYLLSNQPPRSLHLMARIDFAALELIRKCQENPAFRDKLELLDVMETQLRKHVESARRGGFLPTGD